jgi:AcrR family transcriptional regulator
MRGYHKGNVADDLRAAAERLLEDERLEDITLRRLTKEVGVSSGNFYNHYSSVDGLLFDIAATRIIELADRAALMCAGPGSKADRLLAVSVDLLKFTLRNRELIRLILVRPTWRDHVNFRSATTASFTQLVEFIYDERCEIGPLSEMCERYGVAYALYALWHGLGLTITSGEFELDYRDEAALTLFATSVVQPVLIGCIPVERAPGARQHMDGQPLNPLPGDGLTSSSPSSQE